MKTFDTQTEFENYWFGKVEPTKPASFRSSDKAFLVYFTATWCGACKRLDLDTIETAAKTAGVPLWKVEQTVNDYTAGYCQVRSLPSFLLMTPRKEVGRIASSKTDEVVEWIKSNCVEQKK